MYEITYIYQVFSAYHIAISHLNMDMLIAALNIFAENFNEFFNWIIFLQFFTSAISLALTMFQLTVIAPFSTEFYSVVSYRNAAIVEILMYCWFGKVVEIKVPNTTEDIKLNESDWTDFKAAWSYFALVHQVTSKT
ncbi:7tm 6 domain containing protein, partial [Asbolus verrucosus]